MIPDPPSRLLWWLLLGVLIGVLIAVCVLMAAATPVSGF